MGWGRLWNFMNDLVPTCFTRSASAWADQQCLKWVLHGKSAATAACMSTKLARLVTTYSLISAAAETVQLFSLKQVTIQFCRTKHERLSLKLATKDQDAYQ